MIVVDASVAIKWFVAEAGHENALRLLDMDVKICAPDLVISESLNVLWKKVKRKEIERTQALAAIEQVVVFFDKLIPTDDISAEAFLIAEQFDHSTYDSLYLACALASGGVLITADEKFCAKAKNFGYGDIVFELENWNFTISSPQPIEIENILKKADHLASLILKDLKNVDLLQSFSKDELALILAISWFGKYKVTTSFQSLLFRASLFLNGPLDRYTSCIVSLLTFLEKGYIKLRNQINS